MKSLVRKSHLCFRPAWLNEKFSPEISFVFQAWLNEKFSPEIFENKAEIVDCVMEQIHEMEENIRRAKKGDFRVHVHRMEVSSCRIVTDIPLTVFSHPNKDRLRSQGQVVRQPLKTSLQVDL